MNLEDIWFSADHHLKHGNVIKFPGAGDHPGRTIFGSIEEHDEHIIQAHNSVVKKNDKVYFLGDLAWNSAGLQLVERMAGNKTLVMGNHDNMMSQKYLAKIGKLQGAVCLSKHINAVLTHIPVHPCQFKGRFDYNIHGHLHSHVLPDPRYLNVSLERIDYTPINLAEVIQRLKDQEEHYIG